MNNDLLRLVEYPGLPRHKWESEQERTAMTDLLCFGTADMDYAAPEPILGALRHVINSGHLGYAMTPDAYYDAIHNWLLRKTGWDIDARYCVGQNVGIYTSSWHILQMWTKPGDRVAILTPVHFCFKRQIMLNDRISIECPLTQKHGTYEIDYTALDACLASDCKVLWICNPHNPVGRAWHPEELEKIGQLCIKHNVKILSDDVYCGLTFPSAKYTAIASLSPEISQRTVTMYSISKSYNATGLRHSFIVTENPEWIKQYKELLDKLDLTYGQNSMGIAALIAAYTQCDPWLDAMSVQIEQNYRWFNEYCKLNLSACPVANADSTYFAWIDLRALCINPQKLGYLLEQEAHIIVENGLSFGKGGGGFIRVNLATSQENLQAGAERLKVFVNRYQK